MAGAPRAQVSRLAAVALGFALGTAPACGRHAPEAHDGSGVPQPPSPPPASPAGEVAASASAPPPVVADWASVAADLDRAIAACPKEAWCDARTRWLKAAAGHETNVMSIVERTGTAPADDDARALAAQVLLEAEWRQALPESLAPRILAVARARRPSSSGGFDVLMARVVAGVDAEHLRLGAELHDLVSRWPGTLFQTILVEELRVPFPASVTRVEILAELVGHGPEPLERSAIEGLARAAETLLNEAACAALARARSSPSAVNALFASIRIAASRCGAERARALDDIEARERRGQLPGIPWPHFGVLSYLCPYELPRADQERPIRVLHTIALSKRQPMPVRREAMVAVHSCLGGGWRKLSDQLKADPDKALHDEARGVDAIHIDY